MHPRNRVPADHPSHGRADDWLTETDRQDSPRFEAVLEVAELTAEEVNAVRPLLGEVVEGRICRLPPLSHSGTVRAALRMLALLVRSPLVGGPFEGFVRKGLFGAHVELSAFPTSDGFHLYWTDEAEFFSRIFEMELMCFFAANGFEVELRESGGADFIIKKDSVAIEVEAKRPEIDRALDKLYPDNTWEAIRKRSRKGDRPVVGQAVEPGWPDAAQSLTNTVVGLYEKAWKQCSSAERSMIAFKLPVDLAHYGDPLSNAIEQWSLQWNDRPGMGGLLLVHPGGGPTVWHANRTAVPALTDLLPGHALAGFVDYAARFSESRNT